MMNVSHFVPLTLLENLFQMLQDSTRQDLIAPFDLRSH